MTPQNIVQGNHLTLFKSPSDKALLVLFGLGVLFRLVFLMRFIDWGDHPLQYDAFFHKLFVDFFARNFSFPQVDKDFEYPQQPLYYIVAGLLSAALKNFPNYFELQTRILVILSFVVSVSGLAFAWVLIRTYCKSSLGMIGAFSFFCFNPLQLFLAATINNDPFVLTLSEWSTLGMIWVWKACKPGWEFSFTLLGVLLALLTKLNVLTLVGVFGLILLFKYVSASPENRSDWGNRFYAFALMIGLVIGLMFARAYIPFTNEFRFINSGPYIGMEIDKLDWNYFLSFNLPTLIEQGHAQAHFIAHHDFVRQSFWTHLYGSMFMGVLQYKEIYQGYPHARVFGSFIFFFGICLPIFVMLGIYYSDRLLKLFNLGLLVSVTMMIIMILKYPSTCNNNFRYLFTVAPLIGLLIGRGLDLIAKGPRWLIWLCAGFLTLLTISQLGWVISVISIPNHILKNI
ncbi:MAG: hypothetical protein SFT81_01890 [Candidatus Caenarcaniphilales bacterium]|nr:hypothetical protein [Candidatus Caenarcaniphilales bacterium]